MNDTLLVEIYFKWKKATLSEKLKLLQMWESYNAKEQKRQEREIVKEKRPEFIDECAAAAFESFDPTKIKLYDTDLNVLRMLRAINHEGFHALQNDYLFNKSDLIVSGSADKDKFLQERRFLNYYLHYIPNESFSTIFSLNSEMEKMVYKEGNYKFLKEIMAAIDISRPSMFEDLINDYFYIFADQFEKAKMIEKASKSYKSLEQVNKEIEYLSLINPNGLIKVDPSKKIIENQDKEIVDFFNKNYNSFIQNTFINSEDVNLRLIDNLIKEKARRRL